MTRLLLIGLLLACACDQRHAPPQPSAARSQPEPSPLPPPPPADEPATRAPTYRLTGSPSARSNVPTLGELITAGQSVLIIDLKDGTRVVAEPHTRLFAPTFAPSLLLISGQTHITRLPDGARAGVGAARIAMAAGALETSSGSEATLAIETRPKLDHAPRTNHDERDKQKPVDWEMRAQLQLQRGGLTWLYLDQRSSLKEVPLLAGSAPFDLDSLSTGLFWLTSGPAAPAFDVAFRKRTWSRVGQASSQDADRALDAALAEQEVLRERGHELLASVSPHHAALAKLARDGSTQADLKRDPASTREYQRELVQHAQRSHVHSAQLLLAAERSLLLTIIACGEDASNSCIALTAWSERFSARCASLLVP